MTYSCCALFSVLILTTRLFIITRALKKQKPAAFHRQRVSKLLGEESFKFY